MTSDNGALESKLDRRKEPSLEDLMTCSDNIIKITDDLRQFNELLDKLHINTQKYNEVDLYLNGVIVNLDQTLNCLEGEINKFALDSIDDYRKFYPRKDTTNNYELIDGKMTMYSVTALHTRAIGYASVLEYIQTSLSEKIMNNESHIHATLTTARANLQKFIAIIELSKQEEKKEI